MSREKRKVVGIVSGAVSAAALLLCASSTSVIAADYERRVSGFVSGVAGYTDSDVPSIDKYSFAGDAELHLGLDTIFDNGIRLGFEVEGNVEEGTGSIQEPESSFVEQAFVFVDTFFGKVQFGRVDGIGAQYAYLSPTVFYANGINDRQTDLSRLNVINSVNSVRNGFDDYSVKVAFQSPRILGLKGGVSYAPSSRDCESEYCENSAVYVDTRDYENIVEVGLDYLQKINAVTIGVSASYLRADVDDSSPFQDTLNSYSLGANFSMGGFTIGGSFKESGLGDSRGEYTAYDIGASYERGPWGFMVAYGADDSEIGLATIGLLGAEFPQETSAIQGGLDYSHNEIFSIGGGVQFVESDRPASAPSEDSTVVFLETMVSF